MQPRVVNMSGDRAPMLQIVKTFATVIPSEPSESPICTRRVRQLCDVEEVVLSSISHTTAVDPCLAYTPANLAVVIRWR